MAGVLLGAVLQFWTFCFSIDLQDHIKFMSLRIITTCVDSQLQIGVLGRWRNDTPTFRCVGCKFVGCILDILRLLVEEARWTR